MPIRFSARSRPALPPGQRVYAIGDVHGEGDLLCRVLRLIRADNDARGDAEVTIVFVGDLIDRGPDAAALLKTFTRMNRDHVVVIRGNHEAALVEAYRGDHQVLIEWLPFGAATTLAGFGITVRDIDSPVAVLAAALRRRVDPAIIDWLEGLPATWECGDYFVTHAGIRPGVALDAQDPRDLQWIREPFLSSRRRHGKVIVHGHTVEPGVPRLGGNRIGIDTGAHEHGVLTALGLEGEAQWLVQATADRPGDGAALDDIAALIAAIVTPPRGPAPPLELRSPLARRRGLGNKGYGAAGFALVAAALGGAIALGTRPPPAPPATSNVTIPFPGPVPQAAPALPAGASVAAPPAPSVARPDRRGRPRAHRPSPGAAPPAAVAPGAADAPSPRLYGAALEQALDDDRAVTRRLNQEELSRQPPAPRPAK